MNEALLWRRGRRQYSRPGGRRYRAWLLPLLIAATLAVASPTHAQQPPDTFRWMDFHSPKDQDTVIWVTRALLVENWTAIREIGVKYDAALVVTSFRATPQSLPAADTFSIWSVSLTNHAVTPLVTGIKLRILDWERFADGAPEELTVLYDNCLDCAANSYFTAIYYDVSRHGWATRWMRGGQGVTVWSANATDGSWTQMYAVVAEGDGHTELVTWNHFDYGKQKPPQDMLYRYDRDPVSGIDRTALLSGQEAGNMKHRLCSQDVVQGLSRGLDSPLCEQLFPHPERHPVTTPPANNRGRSAPPGVRH